METVFLLIYGFYISGKKTIIQNQHEHDTELHTDIYYFIGVDISIAKAVDSAYISEDDQK